VLVFLSDWSLFERHALPIGNQFHFTPSGITLRRNLKLIKALPIKRSTIRWAPFTAVTLFIPGSRLRPNPLSSIPFHSITFNRHSASLRSRAFHCELHHSTLLALPSREWTQGPRPPVTPPKALPIKRSTINPFTLRRNPRLNQIGYVN
jgi:hypothetical protein